MRTLEIAGCGLAEQLEGLGAFGGREGADHQTRRLMRERLRERRMAVAEAGHCDSGEEIDVDVAVGVGQRSAIAALEGHSGQRRDSLAARRYIARLFGEDLPRPRSGYLGDNSW